MKILIVEDELLERRAMVQMIQDGFPKVREILTASNGEMAIDCLSGKARINFNGY